MSTGITLGSKDMNHFVFCKIYLKKKKLFKKRETIPSYLLLLRCVCLDRRSCICLPILLSLTKKKKKKGKCQSPTVSEIWKALFNKTSLVSESMTIDLGLAEASLIFAPQQKITMIGSVNTGQSPFHKG